jgi:phosphatidylserine/phosphatidylglycerophosphate/cardiolipin synthase-like enzyme
MSSLGKKDEYDKQKYMHIIDFNQMRKANHHTEISNNIIQPYFENLEEKLIILIKKSSYVIGCAAWLTNKNIIEALENTKGVKIIVNKEEYLSSKMIIGQRIFYKCLRENYNKMHDFFAITCGCCNVTIHSCKNFKKNFSNDFDCDVNNKSGAILTCGIVNNYSKMHHKFLVFINDKMEPSGVWTGSYNFSANSNFSLENALYITDHRVITEYIQEFAAIYPFSEICDWEYGILSLPLKK